jgi:3-oxoacyl-[acyl-carrier-protein] synthase-3
LRARRPISHSRPSRAWFKRSSAFDVNSVCAGFVFSLDVAQSMMLAAPDQFRHVLVIGADAFSKILNWDDRRTCIFFGDGAGAVLTSQTADHARRIHFRLGSDGRGSRCIEVPAGGTRVPVTQEVLEKRLNTFFLDGPKVWTSRSRPCRARSAACCVNAGSRPRISIS